MFKVSAFLMPRFKARALSVAISGQANECKRCSRPSPSERAMNAENASELQQTVTEPAAETRSEQLTEMPVAGEQQASNSESTAESRSKRPSDSKCRPPRRSRSRSREFMRLQLPTVPATWVNFSTEPGKQLLIPVVKGRPRCMMDGCWIDWDTLKKWTEVTRVTMLRRILINEETCDSFKLWCVNEKMGLFENEDELLCRLQNAETKDLPPPDTPEDKERKIQVKALFSEMIKMRSLLYRDIVAGIVFCA